jgi:TatD DNase family protein
VNSQHAALLLDAHAHLQARQFDADRAAVLQRARAAGVVAIVCASDDLDASAAAVALAEQEPDVWASVGVHPHEASSYNDAVEERLTALAASPRVVAVGEIGLDYYRDRSPRPQQRQSFERQLALASRLGKPVAVHSRDAAEDTYAILHAWREGGAALPVQMHCFGYDAAWAERCLELGCLISVAGTVTYPNAAATRAVAAAAPEDRLLVETDCPVLAPQSRRGKRNEPAYVAETVACIAAIRGVAPARLARATAENALRLFGIAAGALQAKGVG